MAIANIIMEDKFTPSRILASNIISPKGLIINVISSSFKQFNTISAEMLCLSELLRNKLNFDVQ